MGWSKWSCKFFFLQLLILLPLSLELELRQFEEDSSCQCPKYQPYSYPNLAAGDFIQASVVQDPEKVLAELQDRIKKELIAELGAAIQSTLKHLSIMVDDSPSENVNKDVGFPINNYPKGPTQPANDYNDVPSESHDSEKGPTLARSGSHLL